MAEYINREEAIALLQRHHCDICPHQKANDYHCVYCEYSEAFSDLEDIPTADVVERRSCNTCKYYEGVHNAQGCAPCSFLNIGCIMWNDFCSRWEKENG